MPSAAMLAVFIRMHQLKLGFQERPPQACTNERTPVEGLVPLLVIVVVESKPTFGESFFSPLYNTNHWGETNPSGYELQLGLWILSRRSLSESTRN